MIVSSTALWALHDTLQQVHEIHSAAPVVIQPDPGTPLGHVIDVYDLSRLAGFGEVQFAVSQS